MKLEYQEQAVLNAKKILEEYGGVFVADVVGLGKTYIATLLAGQLDGRTLVIAPPVLLDEDNPGSWKNAFADFGIPASFESIGKLDDILDKGVERFKNIIIDEAHRFRTETNMTYEKLAEICGERCYSCNCNALQQFSKRYSKRNQAVSKLKEKHKSKPTGH